MGARLPNCLVSRQKKTDVFRTGNGERPYQGCASEEELSAIWKALDELDNRLVADVIAMLLLTGAKRFEVLGKR